VTDDERMARTFIHGLRDAGIIEGDKERLDSAVAELVVWAAQARVVGIDPAEFLAIEELKLQIADEFRQLVEGDTR
jgi:hypothetical protein